MQEWCYDYDDILEHHGILGQKWGVRRYQYKDGTLTPAGKRRYKVDSEGNLVEMNRKERKQYAKEESKAKAEEHRKARLEREQASLDKKKEAIAKSHDPKQIYDNKDLFTDQELQTLFLRLNTERNISNLIPKEKEKTYADYVDKLAKNVDSTTKLVESGTRAYNAFAKIANSVEDYDLPIIGEKKNPNKQLDEETESLNARIRNKKARKELTELMKGKTEQDRLREETEELRTIIKNKKTKDEYAELINGKNNKNNSDKDLDELAKRLKKMLEDD